jgi:amino acid transporter
MARGRSRASAPGAGDRNPKAGAASGAMRPSAMASGIAATEFADAASGRLPRVVGPFHATALNMLHMVGVGPFITIPLLLATFGGPQAMWGWVLGAVVAVCDGLVWTELGVALPASGGPYVYMREAFGPKTFGRLASFLFAWQIVLTAPLSAAAACIGFADYAAQLIPIPLPARPIVGAAVALLCTLLLYRNIRETRGISVVLWIALVGAVVWIIAAGLPLADWSRLHAGSWPHGRALFTSLGHATQFAMYDYAGYWTVNYFAEEIRQPERTIPRAVLGSIAAVAAIYLSMNLVIVAALPLSTALHSKAVATDLAQRAGGRGAAIAMTVLILWITLASLYSLLLGYSRLPFAAARDGNFFRVFAHLHPTKDFPDYSLLLLGGLAAFACLLSLQRLIVMLLVLQIFMKFVPQIGAQFAIRVFRRDIRLPFRMWLYPLPALIALAGWTYIAVTANKGLVGVGLALFILGVAAFLVRSRYRREWPFAAAGGVHAEE